MIYFKKFCQLKNLIFKIKIKKNIKKYSIDNFLEIDFQFFIIMVIFITK